MEKEIICPCKRSGCERHGDCAACRAHHAQQKNVPAACDRLKARGERKAERVAGKQRR